MKFDSVRGRLRHVYWLGGSPCSGKSTVAALIGERRGVDVYHVDEAVRVRFGAYDAARQPCMHRWTAGLAGGDVTWDDLWMRPVDALLDEVFQCYGEQFALVVEDLLHLQPRAPLLVEGNSLLPERLRPLLWDEAHALWMVAEEAFQRREYPRRGAWVQSILDQCSDGERALQNWMDRDAAFAQKIAAQVEENGGRLIRVDGERSVEETAELVLAHFGMGRVTEGAA